MNSVVYNMGEGSFYPLAPSITVIPAPAGIYGDRRSVCPNPGDLPNYLVRADTTSV